MSAFIANLHFLRPMWLWGLLALPLLLWWWRARRARNSVWHELVDPHLLPHLLGERRDVRSWMGAALGAVAYVLAVLALSGPTWRQSDQPLWRSNTPLVIALDLSSATLAPDLPPSRLAQARAKLATLLRQREGGQVALVAYADDAYTVVPLTDDAANVALFLDALQPDVMPVDGQRSDRAIAWSAKLLQQAGFDRGDIVLMTDRADAAARTAAASAASDGYRVSVLGLGSETGAAYRRTDGAIVTARLDSASLRRLANSGDGRYVGISADDRDLRMLGVLNPASAEGSSQRPGTSAVWRDEGYWLLPPLLLLALLAFRRRPGAFAVLLMCVWWPWQSAQAADLWRRADQQQHARLEQGTAAYRRGDFAGAAQHYQGIESADGHYNLGNALAKQGQYDAAIGAYDHALQLQPGMPNAIANRKAVEAARKRQHSGPGQQQQQQGGAGQSKQGTSQQSDGAATAGSSQPKDAADQAKQPSNKAQPSSAPSSPNKPLDAKEQQAADAAQRARMQRALEQARKPSDQRNTARQSARETPEQRERRLANEAWLKRIPDDPGGLLRAKFRLEYERRQRIRHGE